jgi:hypothetical protein
LDKGFHKSRRLVSEAGKFATKAGWCVVNDVVNPDESER